MSVWDMKVLGALVGIWWVGFVCLETCRALWDCDGGSLCLAGVCVGVGGGHGAYW